MADKEYKIDTIVKAGEEPRTPQQVYNELLIKLNAEDFRNRGYRTDQVESEKGTRKYGIFKGAMNIGTMDVRLNAFGKTGSIVVRSGDVNVQRLMDGYRIPAPPRTDEERRRAEDMKRLANL